MTSAPVDHRQWLESLSPGPVLNLCRLPISGRTAVGNMYWCLIPPHLRHPLLHFCQKCYYQMPHLLTLQQLELWVLVTEGGTTRPGFSLAPRVCFVMVCLDLSIKSSCGKHSAGSLGPYVWTQLWSTSVSTLEELTVPSSPWQPPPVWYGTLRDDEGQPGFLARSAFGKHFLIYRDCISFLLNGKVLFKLSSMTCHCVCLKQ